MLREASQAKSSGKTNLNKNPSNDPLGHQIKSGSRPKRGVRDYLVSVSKTKLVVGAALTKANQVLGSPLTISTQRVEPITSKTTVLEWVPMLAKSRSEEGAKTRVS